MFVMRMIILMVMVIVAMSTRQGITICKYSSNVCDDSGSGDVGCGYDHNGDEDGPQPLDSIYNTRLKCRL